MLLLISYYCICIIKEKKKKVVEIYGVNFTRTKLLKRIEIQNLQAKVQWNWIITMLHKVGFQYKQVRVFNHTQWKTANDF